MSEISGRISEVIADDGIIVSCKKSDLPTSLENIAISTSICRAGARVISYSRGTLVCVCARVSDLPRKRSRTSDPSDMQISVVTLKLYALT